jgi:hypothetical protein
VAYPSSLNTKTLPSKIKPISITLLSQHRQGRPQQMPAAPTPGRVDGKNAEVLFI